MADQVISAPRFWIRCSGWTDGLGFQELSGVSSGVEAADYWYSGKHGVTLNRQFGRSKPCLLTLKRALDRQGFTILFDWHGKARANNPAAKVTAQFKIMSASGHAAVSCELENAWCSDLDIDAAQAGTSGPLMISVKIQCDSIRPVRG